MLPLLRKLTIKSPTYLPNALALLAAIAYFIQSKIYSITQLSVLDEGAYLLKGYWFATGQYVPYQEFGPFTNHMPMAFLIPGYIQAWFGPGLGVARAFSVLVGLTFMLGLWLLSRRWGGAWWAAFTLWVIALNPALIKMYSVAVTQGIIVALLVWTLFLALGRERPQWQIYFGVILAAVMALTRLNMTPVLMLLIPYIFWEHGRSLGIKAGAIGLAIWLLGHTLYWPGILQMWANYTPSALTPFLDQWRISTEAIPSWTSGANFRGRLLSLAETLRFHFVPLLATLIAWLRWPHVREWPKHGNRRAAIFISYLLALLILMHAIASLGADYCVFCLPLYSAFYSVLGLLLLILVWPNIDSRASHIRRKTSNFLIVLLPVFVALGSTSSLPASFPSRQWIRNILVIDVPRISGLSFQDGVLPFWGFLENRFGFTYAESYRVVQSWSANLILILLGLLFAAIIFRSSKRSDKWLATFSKTKTKDFSFQSLQLLLLVGMLLSPTFLLGGGYQTYDCDQNIIQRYEILAEELKQKVEPGDLIFWRGGRSAIPLLYLDGVNTYPSQLNGDYTYRLGGDPDQLARAGLWGTSVLENWLQQADLILIEQDLMRTWLQVEIGDGPYELQGETAPLTDCSPRSEILIYEFQP